MAYRELFLAWTNKDDAFRQQVAGACLSCATDIIYEDAGTTGHAARLVWANAVRVNPEGMAIPMIPVVLENATIAADVAGATDNDVKYVVTTLIDQFAGV